MTRSVEKSAHDPADRSSMAGSHESRDLMLDGSVLSYPLGKLIEFYENFQDALAESDLEGRFIRFNPAFQELLGYDADDVLGLRNLDITPKRWHAAEEAIVRDQVLRRGYSEVYEKECIRKDGSLVPVEVRTYLLKGPDDQPCGLWSMVRDISGRKSADNEIRKAHSDLRQIFNASVPSAVIGTDFTILKINDTFCTRFNLKREEMVGQKCHEMWPDPYCSTSNCPVRRIKEGATEYAYEWEEDAPDGGKACFAVTAVPYLSPEGELIGIIENYTEITERKLAEARLLKSEQMLRLIMDNIPMGVFWKDRDSVYLGCNPRFAADAGVGSVEEIVGKTDYDLAWASYADNYRADDNEVMKTGTPKINYEEHLTNPRGDRVHLRTSKVPLRDASGEIVAVLGMYDDITMNKRLEEQLRQAQKMESIGQLAGGIAHDFNNLLGGIMGFAELLQDSLQDDPSLLTCTQEIIDTSQRAADLVSQLLAFSRRSTTNMERLSVHEIVDKAVKLLEHSIDRRIVIERTLEANPDEVMGDATLLQNAVLNLAVNARDAMPDGGVLTFKTSLITLNRDFCLVQNPGVCPGNYLELSVIDTGVGMDESVQRQVFEPFFTTKAVGKGTGLGLAAVYGIIKEHRGTIALESQPNQGSRFTLYLPLATTESPIKSEPRHVAGRHGDKDILLVDDEVALRKIGGRILRELGYEVTTATNGKEAIEIYTARGHQIDLVLLDMVMPIMNGEETIRKLRELDPQVRILVTSGYSLNTGIGELPQDIVCGFVQKPYRREQLADAIAQALKPA